MKINWGKVAHVGAKIVGVIVPGVSAVEQIAEQFRVGTGKDKQTAVVEMVQEQLSSALQGVNPLLLFSPRVVTAIRGVIDSIVALQKAIAAEQEAVALPPSSSSSSSV